MSRGECELSGFADVCFEVQYGVEGYAHGTGADYATLAECSRCGAHVLVPPAFHHVLACDGSEVWQEYRFCPACGARVRGEVH